MGLQTTEITSDLQNGYEALKDRNSGDVGCPDMENGIGREVADGKSERVAGGRANSKNVKKIDAKAGMCSCTYVFSEHGTSPAATPLHTQRCKSPFLPSFKGFARIFTFPSLIFAKVDAFIGCLKEWERNGDGSVQHMWSHMKLGGSVSETVMGKLRVGTRIVRRGGLQNWFKTNFRCVSNEKLLKTSACYLSISNGPLAGLLFVSTHRIAFCSDTPISFKAKDGRIGSCYYRVAVPLGKVKSVKASENSEKPSEKYIQVETVDGHEFWFMGFLHFHKSLNHLQNQLLKPQ